jgi:CO/xanthine dehydrogenase FAD-binding subunit
LAVHTPDSVAGVLAALDDGGVVIAGGTHVMPRLNTQATGVTSLVSLRRAGLAGVELVDDATVRVGAGDHAHQLGRFPRWPFLRPALDAIASPRSATWRRSAATCSSPSPTATWRSACWRWTRPPSSRRTHGGSREPKGS